MIAVALAAAVAAEISTLAAAWAGLDRVEASLERLRTNRLLAERSEEVA
jgi:hypothetical protein